MKSLPTFHHVLSGPANAPCLTFIPGIGNDAEFWAQQAQSLSADFRVLRFDPWGHGHSPAPPPDCNFATLQAGVVQLWDALGIRQSAVIGLGFGGSLALALGLDWPERVTQIVAFCCRPRQPDNRREFWRERCKAAHAQGLDALADVTVDRWLSADFRALHPQVDTLLRRMMRTTTLPGYLAYVQAFIEMDFDERLPALRVPTLLVAAEHDHGGGPVADMQHMASRNPNCALHVIPGVGHICNHEAPVEVERLLRTFLQP